MAQQEPTIEKCVVVIAIHQPRCLVTPKQRLKPGDVHVARFARFKRDIADCSRSNRKYGPPRASRVARTDVEEAVPNERSGDGAEVRHSGKLPYKRSVESV